MRGLSFFLSILAVVAAGASAALFFLVGNQRGSLAQNLAAAKADAAHAQQRLADMTAGRDQLAKNLAALQADLDKLRERNTALEARNGTLSREVTQIRDQLGLHDRADQDASSQVVELRRQLEEAKNAAAAASRGPSPAQVAAYEARINDLEAEIAVLRAGATTPTAEQLANVPQELAGNVIDVGPQDAFVVLNIGSRNGAVPSLEMVLRRGSTIVARVRLTDVRDSYSVAHVLPKTGTGNIRAGDTASRS